MAIKFIKAGLQTTVQDLGRNGFRQFGIASNGALDAYSHRLANWLVGNPEDRPCIEITQIGPTIEFTQNLTIAITGAEFELFVNEQPRQSNCTLSLKSGDILRFGRLLSGSRAYLSIAGKLNLQPVMQSYSTNILAGFGGYCGRPFKDKDLLEIVSTREEAINQVPEELMSEYNVALQNGHFIIRVTTGREFELLNPKSQKTLFETNYSMSSLSNRMATKLEGETLETKQERSMTTVPIVAGTMQLPPHGQPIITLADGQTTGGYPRIAQVITADLSLLAQTKAHDTLSFYPVTIEQANQALIRKNIFISSHLD